ncbi:GNAT family N-acetyltransferase [Stappia sp. ES.058]|uniref:GNAT family N-acetyltransferase n=1 Tax=Stappia sp. ES.058 TaxID=1881061 RepID=UPI00087BAE8A|nr:GNAT family N-acetyltransferase [Stappia sp. ES.058]SDU48330.1 Ribosomal protein S18 acetylase RimI [Stappia sp. ES.058]
MTDTPTATIPKAAGNELPRLARATRRGLSFRRIGESDLPFLAALYASTRREEVAPLPWSEAEKAAFLEMQFQAQHTHYMQHYPDADWLVVERDGIAIGRLYLERWPSEIRIIDIALMPESRGEGYGTAMLRDVMALAKHANLGVGIHVEHNNPAMRLYTRLGFTKREDKGVYHLMRWNARASA